jgi:hypothetical protein
VSGPHSAPTIPEKTGLPCEEGDGGTSPAGPRLLAPPPPPRGQPPLWRHPMLAGADPACPDLDPAPLVPDLHGSAVNTARRRPPGGGAPSDPSFLPLALFLPQLPPPPLSSSTSFVLHGRSSAGGCLFRRRRAPPLPPLVGSCLPQRGFMRVGDARRFPPLGSPWHDGAGACPAGGGVEVGLPTRPPLLGRDPLLRARRLLLHLALLLVGTVVVRIDLLISKGHGGAFMVVVPPSTSCCHVVWSSNGVDGLLIGFPCNESAVLVAQGVFLHLA